MPTPRIKCTELTMQDVWEYIRTYWPPAQHEKLLERNIESLMPPDNPLNKKSIPSFLKKLLKVLHSPQERAFFLPFSRKRKLRLKKFKKLKIIFEEWKFYKKLIIAFKDRKADKACSETCNTCFQNYFNPLIKKRSHLFNCCPHIKEVCYDCLLNICARYKALNLKNNDWKSPTCPFCNQALDCSVIEKVRTNPFFPYISFKFFKSIMKDLEEIPDEGDSTAPDSSIEVESESDRTWFPILDTEEIYGMQHVLGQETSALDLTNLSAYPMDCD